MRSVLVALVVGVVGFAVGCKSRANKFDLRAPHVEEFTKPPDENRYNLPPEKGYTPPPPSKEFRPGPNAMQGMGPMGPGGPGR